jgi:hypothetical protein
MQDAIDLVGQMIADQTSNNFHGAGNELGQAAKFRRDLSNMTMEPNGAIVYTGEPEPTSTNPVVVDTGTFYNKMDVENDEVFPFDKTIVHTFSWSLNEGIEIGASFDAKIPLIGDAKASTKVSFSSSQGTTNTNTEHWGYTANIKVPARSSVKVDFVISEANYEIPFLAPVAVRGTCVVQFPDGSEITQEISKLINKLGWDVWAFTGNCQGTFKGVKGLSCDVTATQGGVVNVIGRIEELID